MSQTIEYITVTRSWIDGQDWRIAELTRERDELKARLADLRIQHFEEAATIADVAVNRYLKICTDVPDSYYRGAHDAAAAIRNAKQK